MDLVLIFTDRAISGDGNDDIGRFFVTGRFDETNGECYWTKTYVSAHDVYYRGFREGKGIWGVWELPSESGDWDSMCARPTYPNLPKRKETRRA